MHWVVVGCRYELWVWETRVCGVCVRGPILLQNPNTSTLLRSVVEHMRFFLPLDCKCQTLLLTL